VRGSTPVDVKFQTNELKKMESGRVDFVTMHTYFRECSCARRKYQCLHWKSASYFDNKYWGCGVQQPGVPLLHNTTNLGIMVASICVASRLDTADGTAFTAT
jgi:hypothetical protein